MTAGRERESKRRRTLGAAKKPPPVYNKHMDTDRVARVDEMTSEA